MAYGESDRRVIKRARRTTDIQERVLNLLLADDALTLQEAFERRNIKWGWIRKWMADKEFLDSWEDIERWRRVKVRQKVVAGLAAAADRLLAAAGAGAEPSPPPPLPQGERGDGSAGEARAALINLAVELRATADRLIGAEQLEAAVPVRAFGWAERKGMFGRPIDPAGPGRYDPPVDGDPRRGRRSANAWDEDEADPPADRPTATTEAEPIQPLTRAELDLMIMWPAECDADGQPRHPAALERVCDLTCEVATEAARAARAIGRLDPTADRAAGWRAIERTADGRDDAGRRTATAAG